MPLSQVPSYYRIKANINAPKGGMTVTFNLNGTAIASPQDAFKAAQALLYYQGMVAARNCNIVNAVISQEVPGGSNTPDGIRINPLYYQNPTPEYDPITFAVEEPSVEAAVKPSDGLAFEFDTGLGYVEKRLIRCIRGSWIENDDLVFPLPAPLAPALAQAAVFPGGVFTPLVGTQRPDVMLNSYLCQIRDVCALYLKQIIPAVGPPTPSAAKYQMGVFTNGFNLIGLGNRALGRAWPRVAGRKPVLA
jgi:hypothetical protein